MIRFSQITIVFGFGLISLIITAVIVLALIPVYLQENDLVISYADKTKSFASASQFTRASRRSVTAYVDPIDASSFPQLQYFVRNLLTEYTNVPRSVTIQINEAYVDSSSSTLYLLGTYIFPLFCGLTCQTNIFNNTFQINGGIETLNNLSISSLNDPISLNIHENTNNLILLNFAVIYETLQNPITFTYGLTLTNKAQVRSNTNQNINSLYQLIQQTLSLTNDFQNVQFIITNNTMNVNNTELDITIQLQYPVYCTLICIQNSISDLFNVIFNSNNFTALTYQNGNMIYQINSINLANSDLLPPSAYTLSYPLDNNITNITTGMINDANSLVNIKQGIGQSLNTTINFEIEQASIGLQTISRAYIFRQTRIRRKTQSQYVLIVLIRFIFQLSQCNYQCQQNMLSPVINSIRELGSITILGIQITLGIPNIQIYGQYKPSLTTTTSTTTFTPITHNFG